MIRSSRRDRPDAVLLDLLMATMDSISTYAVAAGDRDRGLAWRDRVTDLMIEAGRYVPYGGLVSAAATELRLPASAPGLLRDAWRQMRRWPDAETLASSDIPFAFVTNCSAELSAEAAERSGLRPTFTLSAEEAGWYKPRPEIYRLACERLAVAPTRIRYVAGAVYDARGAFAAGLRPVLVRRRHATGSLPRQVDAVDSLREALAGPSRAFPPN